MINEQFYICRRCGQEYKDKKGIEKRMKDHVHCEHPRIYELDKDKSTREQIDIWFYCERR